MMENNQPLETSEIVHIKDIKIPKIFRKTKCSFNKIRWAKEYYERNGRFDKPISVVPQTNEKGYFNTLILVDEFSRFLAAKKLNIEHVPVKYIDINEYCEMRNV